MAADPDFDVQRLGSFIEKVREDPSAGATVWRANTTWKKGLASEATITRPDKDHVVVMDEPSQLGGSDTGPNMVEVVLGAYGCCLTAPSATREQLEELHEAVVPTSPVGSIIARPVQVHAELV